ncbi:MAG: PEP-CTERM sorting domain-containing protein, partial [Opitutaceae bacterium]
TAYQITYKISRQNPLKTNELSFSFSVTGGSLTAQTPYTMTSTVSTPPTSLINSDPYQFNAFAIYSLTGTNDFTLDDISITHTAVPEPSTYAACAGAAVLGLAFWRRRRAAARALAA